MKNNKYSLILDWEALGLWTPQDGIPGVWDWSFSVRNHIHCWRWSVPNPWNSGSFFMYMELADKNAKEKINPQLNNCKFWIYERQVAPSYLYGINDNHKINTCDITTWYIPLNVILNTPMSEETEIWGTWENMNQVLSSDRDEFLLDLNIDPPIAKKALKLIPTSAIPHLTELDILAKKSPYYNPLKRVL